MTVEQIKTAVEEMLVDNAASKARIDKEWDGHYGDLSCVEYESNAGECGALHDVLYFIEHGDESQL
jgi:hypothetical protein|tara:strand:+ start:195 stop:392 length:198 start_codon:yes stop_codon:yes gene_type:complete